MFLCFSYEEKYGCPSVGVSCPVAEAHHQLPGRDALVALGPRWPPRWPHRGWLLLPPAEISSEVKAALERSSCLHIMFARSLSGKPGQDVSPQLTCLTR